MSRQLDLVRVVYAKELRETLRDRRTLLLMVLVPLVLYPLLGVGLAQWVTLSESAHDDRGSRVGLQGADWPALTKVLLHDPLIKVVAGARQDQLEKGELDLLLRVPVSFARQLQAKGTVDLELYYSKTREASALAQERTNRALQSLADQIREERIKAADLATGFFEPLHTVSHGLVTPGEATRLSESALAILVVLMVLLGAFYPAIDLIAGEKERGTLETLLVAPVSRTVLINGKYLVVATIASFTGLLNLGAIGLTILLGFGPGLEAMGMKIDIPWAVVVLTILALMLAALFFAAIMVAVVSLARDFKEAQNLLTPVYVICMVPVMAAQIPWVQLTLGTALIPIANVALLARELVAGRVAPGPLILVLLSTLLYALTALRFASRNFNSERLLFAVDQSQRSSTMPQRTTPRPAEAGALLLIVMSLLILVGQLAMSVNLIFGLLVTEWLLIGVPLALFLRWGRLDPPTVLHLNRTSWTVVAGASLAGISAWYIVAMFVERLQEQVLPMPPELIELAKKTLFAKDRPLALDLVALALSPAICEELLFRGILLRASRAVMTTRWSILLNGLLFGLFHMDIYRFLPTMFLGMMLTFIVLRSGSIFPAMLFHFLNNACAIVAGRLINEAEVKEISPWLVSLVVMIFIAGLALILRGSLPPDDTPSGKTAGDLKQGDFR